MALRRVSVILIGGLAFVLAFTPARNSDLWLHLASGREVSAGRLLDGIEPFSFTTQGVFWVNHSWLSDFILFQIYRLSDGKALVVAKAALAALLAVLLLCFRQRDTGREVHILAGFAALLGLAPWLLPLHPSLLSLVGIVLTLFLLERPHWLEGVSAERARAGRWLLVPLFTLWANLDGWFVLGPVLVGLYMLGELLSRRFRGRSGDPVHRLFLLFCAGWAACLATPYHYRIFTWPVSLGLTAAEQALRHDPLGRTLIFSPFGAYFAGSPLFRSPGAWAYYFLLVASAASFVLAIRTSHPGRLLVWLALAALSIYQARTIPFFVVAAAPLLALNVQEWVRKAYQPAAARAALAGAADRAEKLAVLAGLVLLVLAWPGWLQPAPYQPRAGTVEPDDSLVRMTAQVKRWHANGRFPPDRFALNFSPEVAHYLAWFCPEEKVFIDSRWPLFDHVAKDYVRMRRCLLQENSQENTQELASLLDAYGIARILLYDSDWERLARAYRHLFWATSEWELLAIEGGATLFRRHQGPTPSADAFDYRHAAYHSVWDPPLSPTPRPQPPRWFDAFRWDRHLADQREREEAALHLLSFDLQVEKLKIQWLLAQATSLIGCGSRLELAARLHFSPPFPPAAPEPLLLAVRAARRALAVHPEDARAFLLLGEAYFRLDRQTYEASWQAMLPDLAALRQTQMLTALEQAVLLQPNLDRAHALLAQLYYEEGQMDRCLDHLRARLQIAERADKHADFTAALRERVQEMEKLVNDSERTYQANLTGLTSASKVLDRAQKAASYGLSRKALEMMQESSPFIFGRKGVEYQLDLMMQAGQGYEVFDALEPDLEFKITEYHWLKARAAASCGNYAEADAELDKRSQRLRHIGLPPTKLVVPVRSAMAFRVAWAVLTRPAEAEGIAGRATALHLQFAERLAPVGAAAVLLRQQADQQVLRGLLALEAGAIEAARQHFRAALDVWGSETAAEAGAGLDFAARPIAQEMLRRIQG
jgi:hypothetical protein